MRNDGGFIGANEARRHEVLGIVALWPRRMDKHIRLVVDKDGKESRESAISGFLCTSCHKTTDEIMNTRDGEKCSRERSKRLSELV